MKGITKKCQKSHNLVTLIVLTSRIGNCRASCKLQSHTNEGAEGLKMISQGRLVHTSCRPLHLSQWTAATQRIGNFLSLYRNTTVCCIFRSGLQQHRELEIFYLSIETQLSVAGSSIFAALCERALSKRV